LRAARLVLRPGRRARGAGGAVARLPRRPLPGRRAGGRRVRPRLRAGGPRARRRALAPRARLGGGPGPGAAVRAPPGAAHRELGAVHGRAGGVPGVPGAGAAPHRRPGAGARRPDRHRPGAGVRRAAGQLGAGARRAAAQPGGLVRALPAGGGGGRAAGAAAGPLAAAGTDLRAPGPRRPRRRPAGVSGAAPPRRVRLTLEYDGSGFLGWQRQPSGERTVQATLEEAFARLPGEHGSVLAAGRTDAGVHALAMVAHADTSSAIPDEKLRLALNAHLPRDVAVVRLETCAPGFEAQFHCLYRRYLYRLRVMRDD